MGLFDFISSVILTANVSSISFSVIEKKVVEEITSGSGVRVVPPKEVISQFCSRCSSLDSHILTKLLVSKLNANSAWQTHLVAMSFTVVVEIALMKTAESVVCSGRVTSRV